MLQLYEMQSLEQPEMIKSSLTGIGSYQGRQCLVQH